MGRSITSYFDGSHRKKKHRLVLQALTATATRVMFDTVTQSKMGVIVATFKLTTPKVDGVTGIVIDQVEVEMDLWEANKFASQMMAAIDAALPRRATGARQIPWEG